MSSDTPSTIPIKYEFQGSLRRTSIGIPPRFNQLRNKLAKSFPKFAHLFQDRNQILRLIYTDDEGDEITITSNDELVAAYRLAHEAGKVLKFTVPKFDSNEPTRVTTETSPANKTITVQQNLVAQKESQVSSAETSQSIGSSSKCKTPRMDAIPLPMQVVHYGFSCDRSGMNPIVGTRYHKRGTNFDLCEAEYNKITDDAERACYELIAYPDPNLFPIGGRFPGPQYRGNGGLWCIPGGHFRKKSKKHWRRQKKKWMRQHYGQQFYKSIPTITFVRDETVTDGDTVHVGTCFEKKWILNVSGPQGLPSGTTLNFVSGDVLGACSLTNIVNNEEAVPANTNFTVCVKFKPQQQSVGYQCSCWRLVTASGLVFGPLLWVAVNVLPVDRECGNFCATIQPLVSSNINKGKIHTGIRCDASGVSPIVGNRFWKRGCDYDLCQVEFNKLPAAERGLYVRIDYPDSEEAKFAQISAKNARECAEKIAATKNVHMNFLSHVTIPDGAKVECGKTFRKTWQVFSKSGWSSLELRCLDGVDSPYQGLSEHVPPVPPGARADLSITLTAPNEGSKSLRSSWGLVNAVTGEHVGDTLWVYFVTAPLEEKPGEQSDSTSQGLLDGHQNVNGDCTAVSSTSTSATVTADEEDKSSLLVSILAAINVVPQEKKKAMSDLLYTALSTGDYMPIITALAEINVHLQ